MRTIHDVLKEKEEKLSHKLQEIKSLESQVAKLRGAIEIMKEEEQGEPDILQLDSPPPAPARSVPAPSAQPAVRNWP
jgi:hypothetical protein